MLFDIHNGQLNHAYRRGDEAEGNAIIIAMSCKYCTNRYRFMKPFFQLVFGTVLLGTLSRHVYWLRLVPYSFAPF